jgi:hypothetical protein
VACLGMVASFFVRKQASRTADQDQTEEVE